MIDYCKTLGKHISAYTHPWTCSFAGLTTESNGALDQYLIGLSSCLARRGRRQTPGRNGGEQDLCSGARDSLFPANPFKISWMVLKMSGRDMYCFSERPTEFPLDEMGLDPFIMEEAKIILKANISSKNMLFALVPNHKQSSFLFLNWFGILYDSIFTVAGLYSPNSSSPWSWLSRTKLLLFLFFFLNTI